ncbi:hypothetical protein [Thermosulfurimonas sp. F29]|uniref:hypothetical protein n=1 Tax=Thermosulfurimonas sp. F29 TaxID=2867247 RepID=UPI001C839F4B|nr:hypothetical protein [Thermosulfurimonas sp. F29]MBX6424236.1 hypothetical protein [Thermosulfurimonas sp. F29]
MARKPASRTLGKKQIAKRLETLYRAGRLRVEVHSLRWLASAPYADGAVSPPAMVVVASDPSVFERPALKETLSRAPKVLRLVFPDTERPEGNGKAFEHEHILALKRFLASLLTDRFVEGRRPLRLLFACEAGVSRSASLAAFVLWLATGQNEKAWREELKRLATERGEVLLINRFVFWSLINYWNIAPPDRIPQFVEPAGNIVLKLATRIKEPLYLLGRILLDYIGALHRLRTLNTFFAIPPHKTPQPLSPSSPIDKS